jgi:hypothetical protein
VLDFRVKDGIRIATSRLKDRSCRLDVLRVPLGLHPGPPLHVPEVDSREPRPLTVLHVRHEEQLGGELALLHVGRDVDGR